MTRMTRAALAALMIASGSMVLTDFAMAQNTRADRARRSAARRDAAETSGPALSRAVGTLVQEAQTKIGTKDFAGALAALQKAQAESGRTDYDNLKINQFLVVVQEGLGNRAGAVAAAEAAAETPNIPEAEKEGVLFSGTVLALNAQHYDKALGYAKQLQALNPADARTKQAMGQAFFLGGDMEGAKAIATANISAATAAGQLPPKDDLDLLLNVQIKSKDTPGAEKTLEDLAIYYNDARDWQQILNFSMGTPGIKELDILYLGRLLFTVGVPVNKENADLIGGIASQLAFFGDAVRAKEKGGTAFADPVPRANADKASIPQQIAAGEKQNGQYNVKLAQSLYGYGMYPEAEKAARLAMTKGGGTDPNEAPMVLGMILVAQGRHADAVAAFEQVKGGTPGFQRVHRLWTGYARQKAKPPAAPAPAPQPAAQ